MRDGKVRAEPETANAIYTCPMHPQIRHRGPGACPICGMALEPLDPAAARDDSEYRDMRFRFFVSLALSAPVFALAMAGAGGIFQWIEFALSAPVVIWLAAPFFARGWKGALAGHANMFTLIGLGVGVAFGYSVVALIFPSFVPRAFHGMGGAPPVYFEAASVIVTLVLIGQVLELRARARTGAAVRALLDLSPKTVRRRIASGTEDIPLENVRVGDVLIVRANESIPTDGEAIEGQSAVDESMLTGESMPVEKSPGSKLTGGTLNGEGMLVDARHARGRRYDAGEDRGIGGRGAAQPRADAGARRCGRRVVRAAGGAGGTRRVCCVVCVRARAAIQLRADRGGVGSDHRVSLRAGLGHADVGDGVGGERRAGGRAGAQCRVAGASGAAPIRW